MKKASSKKNNDELRSEYDLSQLKGAVRGKYFQEATTGTNLVLIGGRRWSSTRDVHPEPSGACPSERR
jgi:hypothetical protein